MSSLFAVLPELYGCDAYGSGQFSKCPTQSDSAHNTPSYSAPPGVSSATSTPDGSQQSPILARDAPSKPAGAIPNNPHPQSSTAAYPSITHPTTPTSLSLHQLAAAPWIIAAPACMLAAVAIALGIQWAKNWIRSHKQRTTLPFS